MSENKTYEDGLRDGQIDAIEKMIHEHKGRIDNHAGRLRILERVMWLLTGAMAVLQFWPQIQTLLKGAAP